MKRAITGYHRDDHGDWVAELSCHHGQHVRHQPPFTLRPWVETEEGRKEKLGMMLDCVRCDALELPDGLTAYKRTQTFTEDSIPAALQSAHMLRAGVWGLIHVCSGCLLYIPETDRISAITLRAGQFAAVPPQMPHRIQARGKVCCFVEFYRKT